MPIPDNIEIFVLDAEINGGCNYKCRMCPQSQGREREFLRKLPLQVFEKMLDDAMQYGLKTVTLHGSGEPTLNKNFPDFVKLVKDRDLTCISFTNGKRLTEELSERLINAGIDVLRLSCIGYDKPTYEKWMEGGDFDLVRENARRFVRLAENTVTEMHINHLIIDPGNVDEEVKMYRRTWGEYTGARSEIWLMHNWSASEKILVNYQRAPLLQVRAGGLGAYGAVVACCMVLGHDSKAVLGHLETQTIEEIVSGEAYEKLRRAHTEERFDDIDYCKGCDQLFDTPEALVWCDIPGREYGQSKNLATLNFNDYS
jgi:organic radical activating enzyme